MGEATDFFVSYTSVDQAWAEWIAWQLEAEGYGVIVQAWDFRPGSDFVQQMHKTVEDAQGTIAVLSPAYLMSDFGGAEWRAVFAKDPTGEQGLLVPVRVSDVEPRGLLRSKVYIDLFDKDASNARTALLAAARGVRGKPSTEPVFPGVQRQAVSVAEAPRYPGELPPVWNVPFHPNPFFTDRDALLAELHTRLTAPDGPARRVVLTGLGGVGKTQLAVEYAYRQQRDYDLVWWVRAEQPETLLGDYAALVDQALVGDDLKLPPESSQENEAAAVRAWLERHRRWLLVVDNVDDRQAVAELLPRSSTGHVLLTSQGEVGWDFLADPLPVGVLAATDAAMFILTRTKQSGPAAEAAATTLASTLGGLPLALEQASADVIAGGTVTLGGYAKLFASRALELMGRGQPFGSQHTVATTWSLALQTLQETKPSAVGLLTLAAFLAPDDLPLPLLAAHPDQLPEPLASTAGDPLALGDAIQALRRYSLARIIGDGLYVHRLLQIVVRADLESDIQAEIVWAATAMWLLRISFPTPSNEIANWADCKRLLPHVVAAVKHGQRLSVEPETWVCLLNQAGVYLSSRGQYQRAGELYEQALTGSQQILGHDHSSTLESMTNLAAVRRDLGDLQGARELREQALAGSWRVYGDDHPSTLASMLDLAESRRDFGDLQGARELHEKALAGYRRTLGDNNPNTMRSMHCLAGTRHALRDLDGARELHEQALTARQRVLGENHPSTLESMTNLAVVRRDLGDLQGARELHEKALAGYRHALGDDHPDTLEAMNDFAETLRALRDLQGAYELHAQILATRRRVLGDDHPKTLASINSLAEIHRELEGL